MMPTSVRPESDAIFRWSHTGYRQCPLSTSTKADIWQGRSHFTHYATNAWQEMRVWMPIYLPLFVICRSQRRKESFWRLKKISISPMQNALYYKASWKIHPCGGKRRAMHHLSLPLLYRELLRLCTDEYF